MPLNLTGALLEMGIVNIQITRSEFLKRGWVLALCLTVANAIAAPVLYAQGSSNSAKVAAPSIKVKPAFQIDILQMRAKFANRVPSAIQSSQPPAGFPVPVYSYNAISANFSQSTSPKYQAVSGTIMTGDEFQLPYQWYKRYFSQNGWTIAGASGKPSLAEQQGKLLVTTATKDKLTVTVSCVKAAKSPFTIVNISSVAAIATPPAK